MTKIYDTIVVGSGPAGQGLCFELLEHDPSHKVLMIDSFGSKAGGMGMLNDCKQNYTYPIGFGEEYWTKEQADEYLEIVKRHLNPVILPKHNLDTYVNRAKKFNSELYIIDQCHVGTDKAKFLVRDLLQSLRNLGVEMLFETEVVDIDPTTNEIILKNNSRIKYKNLVLSVGRSGAIWLQDMMDRLGTKYADNKVDIGVRIEAREENWSIVKDYYDPKFYLPYGTRTFCTNSHHMASVVREKYDGYFSVNGHALSKDKASNGLVNFALLKTVTLTEPLTSGTKYAQILGKAAMAIGGGKPIMQRIGDIRGDKRSKASTFNDDLYNFEPTLKSCTPGDISLAMPAKIWDSIWNSIKILDSIVPGLMHPSTILYYPEIKTYANKPIFIDEHFKIAENVYASGDSAGVSRGITGAWASGIRTARGILKNKKIDIAID